MFIHDINNYVLLKLIVHVPSDAAITCKVSVCYISTYWKLYWHNSDRSILLYFKFHYSWVQYPYHAYATML